MDGKGKAIQVRQKIKVNGALTDALPYNTVDEVYVDPDSNTMLREKLLNIDNTIKTTSAENTKLTGTIVTVETKISDIESNIGSGGNISQEISTIKTEIEEVKQKLNTSYTSALENENRLNVLVNKHQNHKNNKITNLNGVHGVRYVNDVLSYRDNDMNWHEVKSGGDELELIKQALSGQISKNQFIHRRANCTITGGCYKNGKYFINTPILDEGPTRRYRTMTVIIDQNDPNPETRCRYADDAVEMTPGSEKWDEFFGHYPVLFKNGQVVDKLKRDDRTKKEDGSPADITSGGAGDVGTIFPLRWWKIETTGNVVTVSVTDDPNKEGYEALAHTRGEEVKEFFFMGAYDGHVVGGKLRSLNGKTPTTSINISQARAYAQANGTGYDQLMFYPLTYLQIMYVLKYKNTDSQTTIGRGNTALANMLTTGGTETKGMDWGENTGKQHMVLFGLEDFWGNIFQWIDGLYCDAQRNILTATDKFNDTGAGYINQGKGANVNITGYISDVQGSTKTGFITKTCSGSETTHYADSGNLYASCLPCFGGDYNYGSNAGAFTLRVNSSASTSYSYLGARLMFL